VLSRVKAGTLSLGSAATLMAVSYRQAKRLARRYKAEGAKGLKHRGAGGASNHARPTKERERVLALVREKYSGPRDVRFGPTLAAEHLASEDGVTVHHDTLRRWMLAAGLWSRARTRSPHRARRERKAHFGELVQLDGSFHLWYEDRAPRGCLMNLVDDATGRTLARLGAQETIWAAVDVLRRWIEVYGVPLALYTDWKNVYVREPNAEERATGAVPRTQVGRMCAALGIQISSRRNGSFRMIGWCAMTRATCKSHDRAARPRRAVRSSSVKRATGRWNCAIGDGRCSGRRSRRQ
jgi:transposase